MPPRWFAGSTARSRGTTSRPWDVLIRLRRGSEARQSMLVVWEAARRTRSEVVGAVLRSRAADAPGFTKAATPMSSPDDVRAPWTTAPAPTSPTVALQKIDKNRRLRSSRGMRKVKKGSSQNAAAPTWPISPRMDLLRSSRSIVMPVGGWKIGTRRDGSTALSRWFHPPPRRQFSRIARQG